MKINKQRQINKIVVAAVVIATALVATTAGVAWWMTAKPVANQSANHIEQNQVNPADQGSNSQANNSVDKTEDSKDKPNRPKQYEGGFNDNDTTQLNASFSVAPRLDKDIVTMRTTIAQRLNGRKGTCKLTLRGPNNLTYEETVPILDDPQASTCQGFDVPLKKVDKKKKLWSGKWYVSVKIVAQDSKSHAVSTEIKGEFTY